MEEFKPKKENEQYPIDALQEAFDLYGSWEFNVSKKEKEKLKKEFDELVKKYHGIDDRVKWYHEIEDEAFQYYKGILKSPKKEFFEESLKGDTFLEEMIKNFKKEEEIEETRNIVSGKIDENKLEDVMNKYLDNPKKLEVLKFRKMLNDIEKKELGE